MSINNFKQTGWRKPHIFKVLYPIHRKYFWLCIQVGRFWGVGNSPKEAYEEFIHLNRQGN